MYRGPSLLDMLVYSSQRFETTDSSRLEGKLSVYSFVPSPDFYSASQGDLVGKGTRGSLARVGLHLAYSLNTGAPITNDKRKR